MLKTWRRSVYAEGMFTSEQSIGSQTPCKPSSQPLGALMPLPSTNASGLPEPPCSVRVLYKSLPEADLTDTCIYTLHGITGLSIPYCLRHRRLKPDFNNTVRSHAACSQCMLRSCSLPGLLLVDFVDHCLLPKCLAELRHGSSLRSRCTCRHI